MSINKLKLLNRYNKMHKQLNNPKKMSVVSKVKIKIIILLDNSNKVFKF